MKRLPFLIASAAAGLTLSASVLAEGGHALPYSFKADSGNLASVQRGARNFMAYCSGCHSMKHLRYNRLGQDLQIPEAMLKANLMFTSDKVGDHILSSMPTDRAKAWFGQSPPDLTLETRARGADWVYSYLRTFYVDTTRPFGVNNIVLPGVSMPHVLWELQGWQVKEAAAEGSGENASEHAGDRAEGHGEPAKSEAAGHHGHGPGLALAQQGKLTPEAYEKFVADTVNFMAYAAEPGRAGRIALGFKALLYLSVLFVLAYFLKKEYWRDIYPDGH